MECVLSHTHLTPFTGGAVTIYRTQLSSQGHVNEELNWGPHGGQSRALSAPREDAELKQKRRTLEGTCDSLFQFPSPINVSEILIEVSCLWNSLIC